MTIEIVLLFWEAYFIESDRYFILYVVVAVLIHHRELLLNADQSLLPQTLTGINIEKKETIKQIFKLY
jgi:hypothetical protein